MNESAGEKLWKRRAQTALGNRRSDFHFSHSFNNNKLDDRNHFLQNAKTSVASLRRLITPTRNADHDQPGTLIIFIGIRILGFVRARLAISFFLDVADFKGALAGWHFRYGQFAKSHPTQGAPGSLPASKSAVVSWIGRESLDRTKRSDTTWFIRPTVEGTECSPSSSVYY